MTMPSATYPVVAAWGMGVNSTAMIIEWVARGRRLDAVLTADTGAESPRVTPIFRFFRNGWTIEAYLTILFDTSQRNSSIGRRTSQYWRIA